MKFTNGYWLIRPEFQMSYAVEYYRSSRLNGALSVLAPCHAVQDRGATLGGEALTVRFSAPMEGVIRVDITHFAGEQDKGPHFELNASPVSPVIEEDDEALRFFSGPLCAEISKKPSGWQVDYRVDGHILTTSGFRGMATGLNKETGKNYISDSLMLDVGECVYGLGERFTSYVKNGQSVDMWNADGGTASEQAYKNIPFYMTNRGYGVFVNDPGDVSFEVASEKVERVQFSVEGQRLSYCLIYGPTPKEILRRYTALTGRPALPPAWSFGLWLTTSFTTSYDEKTVTSFIQGMADRNIPLHVFHFDCFWMKGFNWCDFEWDSETFPDPVGMLRRYKDRGLRICVWINPYIAQQSPLFQEGMEKGYLIKKTNGDVWQTDLWQSGLAIVDFTNPKAVRWYQTHLQKLLDMGVDCFKTDFGERIPVKDVCYFDGSSPLKMHNYYTQLYNKAVFEVLENHRGKGEATLFARSATAGGQQFPVHWGGDNSANYPSMAETLRSGLSLAHCGFGFWSHDISGFESTAPADVYKRWVAFGLLSSHSRLHGSSSYRVPWLFDEEACDVARFFVNLKCRLMPYLYAAAVEAHEAGTPTMRPMMMEFVGDPACDALDRQYMLGGNLLVAPVFRKDGEVEYYLPDGCWTHLLSGRRVQGGHWQKERHGFLSLPLMVRENSVLAMGANDQRPDYDFSDQVELNLFEIQEGAEIETVIPDLSGHPDARFVTRRQGGRISILAETEKPYSVLLSNIHSARVLGGTARDGERGLRITNCGASVEIEL